MPLSLILKEIAEDYERKSEEIIKKAIDEANTKLRSKRDELERRFNKELSEYTALLNENLEKKIKKHRYENKKLLLKKKNELIESLLANIYDEIALFLEKYDGIESIYEKLIMKTIKMVSEDSLILYTNGISEDIIRKILEKNDLKKNVEIKNDNSIRFGFIIETENYVIDITLKNIFNQKKLDFIIIIEKLLKEEQIV